ncbi:MAG: hypothetical protein JW767_00510 [Thermoleophilia bacterium]|nr:hypothetical protein [Thermoleophilia bacterium]
MNAGRSNDLVERYVWAVARRLPKQVGADVAQELHATIADMVEARGGGEEAVREVLVELGDPAQLAAGYVTKPRHLIGPELYPTYVRLLTTLLLVIVPLVLVVTLVAELWDPVDGVPLGVLAGLQAAAQTGVMVAFGVTLVFAVLERYGVVPGAAGGRRGAWDPATLSPVGGGRQISIGGPVASIVFLSLLLGWVVWQRSHSVFHVDGEPVAFLDGALWDAWVPVFVAIVVAGIAIEVWKAVSGVWTLALVAANVAVNTAFAAFFVALLGTQRVVAPAFEGEFERLSGEQFPGGVVAFAFAAVVVGISAWDSVDCILAWRRRRREAAAGARTAAGAAG